MKSEELLKSVKGWTERFSQSFNLPVNKTAFHFFYFACEGMSIDRAEVALKLDKRFTSWCNRHSETHSWRNAVEWFVKANHGTTLGKA